MEVLRAHERVGTEREVGTDGESGGSVGREVRTDRESGDGAEREVGTDWKSSDGCGSRR